MSRIFVSANRDRKLRIRTAVTLIKHRASVLQLPLKPVQATKPSTVSEILANGVVSAEEGLNRDIEKPASMGKPRYVQSPLREPPTLALWDRGLSIQKLGRRCSLALFETRGALLGP
ncbi:hypothetical protein AYI69_g6322 [Smittium culicis]|uniref:Uncharacterized protein n=1 Tax=Smittium culicis TaxID=133412 RepID=A0A1R1XZT8_9FUNG|nr:hypothetical protein AYI69_g6322 [Smittium culicis]